MMKTWFLRFVILSFVFYSHTSWAKSLWELRGQVQEESSQGEVAKPQTPTAQPTVVVQKQPAEVNPQIESLVQSITIPSQYGRVKERFVGSGDVVFALMQEIHNHPEVQKNNKEIMAILLDQYQFALLLIEGFYGPLRTPMLRSQPRKWREEFAREQLESGYYNAEEYLYLTRIVPPTIIGVDDEKIVKEQYDLIHYQFLVDHRAKADAVFSPLKEAIEQARVKFYTTELKAFDVSAQEYAQDKISAEEFVSILNDEMKNNAMTLSETTYPNITLVVKANEAEEEKTAEGEEGSQFEKAQEYLGKVDHGKLYAEIRELEKEVRTKLYQGKLEPKLDRLAKGLYYFEKLSKISLVPLEWEEYLEEISPFKAAELAKFLTENGIDLTVTTEEIEFLDQYRKEGETFYQIAIDRERTMVENSLGILAKTGGEKRAMLVTGGFHTAAISQFLRSNGISFVVIAPRVTQPEMQTPYQNLLKQSMDQVSQLTTKPAFPMSQRKALEPKIVKDETSVGE